MPKIKKTLYSGLTITIVILLCISGGAISTTISSTDLKNASIPKIQNVEENILLSVENPDNDDIHPKITKNAINNLVVVYEQHEIDDFSKVPLICSSDLGNSWNIKHVFDSLDYKSGTGKLQSPDIKYCSKSNQFLLNMIDPNAELYNNEFIWMPGDVAQNAILEWYGVSASGDYHETAVTFVEEWAVSVFTVSSPSMDRSLHLACMRYCMEEDKVQYPNDVNDNWAQGFYYDGESIFKSHPAFIPEMATGSDRMYLVVQSDFKEGSKITYKSTVTDLNPLSKTFLFGTGGSRYDIYLDPEFWPQQMYLADGTDPDVSASNTNVCIVYTDDGDVKCSYSSNSGQDFSVSTIATDAGYPAVYVIEDKVLCAYVKNGDIYEVLSEDISATWGTASKLNEVEGTVAAEPGSLDVSVTGVVWTDTRNAAKDIYYSKGIIDINPPNSPTINGPNSGTPRTQYEYTVSSTDPDDDYVYYTIDWNDGSIEELIGPHSSGEEITLKHSWNKQGSYNIKVKATDTWGLQSDWTIMSVSMPKNKQLINRPVIRFLLQLLESFTTDAV